MNRPVHVLWTGGWDSTFRVADLVHTYASVVQPHYFVSARRRSTDIEIATMARVREIINTSCINGGTVLPTEIYYEPQRLMHVRSALEAVRAQAWVGHQYATIREIAEQHDIEGFELCIHEDDLAAAALRRMVVRDPQASPTPTWRLGPCARPEFVTLFGKCSFPLFDITKTAMKDYAEGHRFDHIMDMTWFCHRPTSRGNPCGRCGPCNFTRNEGLGYRVPRWGPAMSQAYRRARKVGSRAKNAMAG